MTVTTPLGQVIRDDQGMRLEFVRTYEAPVDDIWSALTDPERVARWIGTVSGDPVTRSVQLRMTEGEGSAPETVTIRECDPVTRLVVDLPSPDGTWRLTAALRAEGGVTTLVFTQRLAEPYDASSVGPGWHYYLDRLGAVVAGRPVPDRWDDYHPSLSDSYALPS